MRSASQPAVNTVAAASCRPCCNTDTAGAAVLLALASPWHHPLPLTVLRHAVPCCAVLCLAVLCLPHTLLAGCILADDMVSHVIAATGAEPAQQTLCV